MKKGRGVQNLIYIFLALAAFLLLQSETAQSCPGRWEKLGYYASPTCICPNGIPASVNGGRCDTGASRQPQYRPPPQPRCPAGYFSHGSKCFQNGHTPCGNTGKSCPNHLSCYTIPSIILEKGYVNSSIGCATPSQIDEIEKEASKLRRQKAEELHEKSEAERKRALQRQKEIKAAREKKKQEKLKKQASSIEKDQGKISNNRKKSTAKILANTRNSNKAHQKNSSQVFSNLKEKSLLNNFRQTPAPQAIGQNKNIAPAANAKPTQRIAYPPAHNKTRGTTAVQDWLDGKKISPSSRTQEKLRQNRAQTEAEIKRRQIEQQTKLQQKDAYWSKVDPMSRALQSAPKSTRRLLQTPAPKKTITVTPQKTDNTNKAQQKTNCPNGILDNRGYHECNTQYHGKKITPSSTLNNQPKSYK